MGGRLENGALPSPLPPSSPWGQSAPWAFSLFFFISASSQSLAFTSISPPPFPPPHQPLSARSLLHTPSSSPPSPHHTLVSLGPEICVTPGCPMAPLTLCIPGITVWGHLPWSLGRGALVGPWHQLSDSHHSPQPSPVVLPKASSIQLPFLTPVSSAPLFFSLDGLPPNPSDSHHPPAKMQPEGETKPSLCALQD